MCVSLRKWESGKGLECVYECREGWYGCWEGGCFDIEEMYMWWVKEMGYYGF
jgi:hypothetical protein